MLSRNGSEVLAHENCIRITTNFLNIIILHADPSEVLVEVEWGLILGPHEVDHNVPSRVTCEGNHVLVPVQACLGSAPDVGADLEKRYIRSM